MQADCFVPTSDFEKLCIETAAKEHKLLNQPNLTEIIQSNKNTSTPIKKGATRPPVG
jgi:hypothetical protein